MKDSAEDQFEKNSQTMGFHNLSSDDWDALSSEQQDTLHKEALDSTVDLNDSALGHALSEYLSEAPFHEKTNAEILQMVLNEDEDISVAEEYEDLDTKELVAKIHELKDNLLNFHQNVTSARPKL